MADALKEPKNPCEEGGGRVIKKSKKSTSGLHLDVREVVLVGDPLNSPKSPPLARVWM